MNQNEKSEKTKKQVEQETSSDDDELLSILRDEGGKSVERQAGPAPSGHGPGPSPAKRRPASKNRCDRCGAIVHADRTYCGACSVILNERKLK